MDTEPEHIQLDPEQFARVWRRVVPEGKPCPVELVTPPQPVENSRPLSLNGCLLQELEQWRSLCVISRPLAQQSYQRGKRLAVADYLLTGKWNFPVKQAAFQRQPLRERLRTLFLTSQTLEKEYVQRSKNTSAPELQPLFTQLAEEHHELQRKIRKILEYS
jgi:hypothetical protein